MFSKPWIGAMWICSLLLVAGVFGQIGLRLGRAHRPPAVGEVLFENRDDDGNTLSVKTCAPPGYVCLLQLDAQHRIEWPGWALAPTEARKLGEALVDASR